MTVIVLALLGRRRFPFLAPAAVWLLAAPLSFSGGEGLIVVSDGPRHVASESLFVPVLFAIAWLAGYALRERGARVEAAEEHATRGVRGTGAIARAARRRRPSRQHDRRPSRCGAHGPRPRRRSSDDDDLAPVPDAVVEFPQSRR